MELGTTVPGSASRSRGLGDTIAKVTKAVGIKPCGGCLDRQKALNEMFPYGVQSDQEDSHASGI